MADTSNKKIALPAFIKLLTSHNIPASKAMLVAGKMSISSCYEKYRQWILTILQSDIRHIAHQNSWDNCLNFRSSQPACTRISGSPFLRLCERQAIRRSLLAFLVTRITWHQRAKQAPPMPMYVHMPFTTPGYGPLTIGIGVIDKAGSEETQA